MEEVGDGFKKAWERGREIKSGCGAGIEGFDIMGDGVGMSGGGKYGDRGCREGVKEEIGGSK